MATKVHMEALSPTMEEGQIVKWHKSEGDQVSMGEILAEIETDKAIMELVARGEGVLRKIFRGESETSQVGDVIAVIAEEGEDISALAPSVGGASAAPEAPKPKSDAEIETKPQPTAAGGRGSFEGLAPGAPARSGSGPRTVRH